MNPTISILAEIPEELYNSLREYLDVHPAWDQDQVFAVALSLFLLQTQQRQPVKLFPIGSVNLPTLPEPETLSCAGASDRN